MFLNVQGFVLGRIFKELGGIKFSQGLIWIGFSRARVDMELGVNLEVVDSKGLLKRF
jgi:hypothetical protein